MRASPTRKLVLAAILALACAPPVLAEAVGRVKVASGSVHIERAGKKLPAPVGTLVESADRIVTGRDGSIGISFLDNSRLALGPGSSLVVDRFDFNQTTHEGRFETTLRRGTLSAVSGKLARQSPKAMTVRTRSTILAVRGTEFVLRTR